MQIKSLDQWNEVAEKLITHNYSRYCTQYRWDDPHGFHAWFISTSRPERIHFTTRLEDVQKAINTFGQPKPEPLSKKR